MHVSVQAALTCHNNMFLVFVATAAAAAAAQIHWMRAARTDKGVSAACQVVSAKLVVDPAETFVERVNALLPQQVRVVR
jgi:tRNA pseudouridine(38-40) synthase